MVIYKSDIRMALEHWRDREERRCKRCGEKYQSPDLVGNVFISKVCDLLQIPREPKTIKTLRPYVKRFKREGVV